MTNDMMNLRTLVETPICCVSDRICRQRLMELEVGGVAGAG